MKWKKMGKLFDPTEHNLPNNCYEYAKSPQAIVFDDFVRIYFSTVEVDKKGKYLSHVAFIDTDKEFNKIINISSKTVIELGQLGCFDEHGIFPVNVLKDNNKILAYTTGWNRRMSVSTDAAVGLAISNNGGLNFQKIGQGPVISASLYEPFLVGDAFVAKFNEIFHMWYIYGIRWLHDDPIENIPQRVYKIAHAKSKDGIDWQKEGRQIISDKLNEDECQALPTVIHFNNIYHMFFSYRQATGFRKDKARAYRIGYAFSMDLKNWTRCDEKVGIDVSETDWDSDMLCYPNVFHCDNNIYMLYNGNEFGKEGFGIAVLENYD